jgi:hypothetical protein
MEAEKGKPIGYVASQKWPNKNGYGEKRSVIRTEIRNNLVVSVTSV